ncbi:hypothetical protein WJX77_009572 [Trebouxia sp. C0004]
MPPYMTAYVLKRHKKEQLNTAAAAAQSHIQNIAASELWGIDEGASEGDWIGSRRRIQPRYAAKKAAYAHQEPVQSDEEAFLDEETGYCHKSKALLQADSQPFEPCLLEANGTTKAPQAVKQAPAIKKAKRRKLKLSQSDEPEAELQPQETAEQASTPKLRPLKLHKFFKMLNTQEAAAASYQQVPTTDPRAMTGHAALSGNSFGQLVNTKRTSVQILQDSAASNLTDLAAQHELEKKLHADATKPPAKRTTSNIQPFTMAKCICQCVE